MNIKKLMRIARTKGLPPVEVKAPYKYFNRWRSAI